MKPIWKSVGFWMGGVVLVFLLWAWGDSMRTYSSLSGGNAMGTVGFALFDSQLIYERSQELYEGWTMAPNPNSVPDPLRWYWDRREIASIHYLERRDGLARVIPGYSKGVEIDDVGTREVRVVVPIWMFCLGWLFLMSSANWFWRRHQAKRAASACEALSGNACGPG